MAVNIPGVHASHGGHAAPVSTPPSDEGWIKGAVKVSLTTALVFGSIVLAPVLPLAAGLVALLGLASLVSLCPEGSPDGGATINSIPWGSVASTIGGLFTHAGGAHVPHGGGGASTGTHAPYYGHGHAGGAVYHNGYGHAAGGAVHHGALAPPPPPQNAQGSAFGPPMGVPLPPPSHLNQDY